MQKNGEILTFTGNFEGRPANHFCLHAWATGSECLENVSDAWNSVTDLKLKGI